MNDHDLMQTRHIDIAGIQLRDTQDGDGLTLTGIAVPFGRELDMWPGTAEVIDDDCDFGARDVKLAREHGALIGRVTEQKREADGLHITARIADTAQGREVADLVRAGVYDAFSIGFKPVENSVENRDDRTIVHRRAVELFEVSVTGIPAYVDAKITGQRDITETPTIKEDTMDNGTETRMDAIDDEIRAIKTALAEHEPAAPAKIGEAYRSEGDYLKALAKGDAEARDLMLATRDLIATGDTGNTVSWIADDLKLIEQRRKVMNILTHDTLPATGMTLEYNVVSSDTTTAAKQASEGTALNFGKVKFGTKSADIDTYGGYTTLSRQVIERSTTPMLNTALKALRNAYAKATENAVRTYLYDLIAAQRDATSNANNITTKSALAAMTPDEWAGIIMDAAEIMDDRNTSLTRLAVSKDVALALIKLKDSGNRFMDISGKGSDTLGSFDLTGVVGDLMRVPVYILPAATAGTACFIDPEAVTVWESGGPTQLSDGDPTKLTENYSVYGYMAVGATNTDGLLPIKFKTA
ncbi:HK97 family phage prohead protease [Bifidobacterium pseudolongum]|uniref:Phage capsid protein n=1 Tax=Bifidobacterium pseudolongum subsp. globosum TaxID=1690 RepID=A0A4Q5A544_9BIFI|nr:HK97 family phage prohead protease [Bifidobacterium pseudolongum]RYQ16983.1 phage capsid protein [Bifidobacterium pseudolongum subsp. globosum]